MKPVNYQIWGQVEDRVLKHIWYKISDQFWWENWWYAREKLINQVGIQVRDQIWDNLESSYINYIK